jgi:hypothetical protein
MVMTSQGWGATWTRGGTHSWGHSGVCIPGVYGEGRRLDKGAWVLSGVLAADQCPQTSLGLSLKFENQSWNLCIVVGWGTRVRDWL